MGSKKVLFSPTPPTIDPYVTTSTFHNISTQLLFKYYNNVGTVSNSKVGSIISSTLSPENVLPDNRKEESIGGIKASRTTGKILMNGTQHTNTKQPTSSTLSSELLGTDAIFLKDLVSNLDETTRDALTFHKALQDFEMKVIRHFLVFDNRKNVIPTHTSLEGHKSK